MRKTFAALAACALLFAVGCGGDDEESEDALTIDTVQACLEDAGLDVTAETDQLKVNGGEVEGGSSVVFYESEAEAAENAKAAKTFGGDVTQTGTVVVITQGGPESDQVEECAT